jgi:E3 Ubiquitin ligase
VVRCGTPVTVFSAFAVPITEWSILALVAVTGGLYLFVQGFRLLARKHLIADTPTSRISSASMGLVEVNGQVNGPYTIPAVITGNSCLLYRTVAWQQGDSRRRNEWDKIAEEKQHVPFFLDDGTGQLLVDAQGAELDLERDYRGEFDASPLSFTALPDQVTSFLARNGATPSRRVRIEEWTIKPNERLFVVGTIAENIGTQPTPSALSSVNEERLGAAPEIIRLSPETGPASSTDMTLQGKIAAALTRAGIQKPEAWAAAGISTETAVAPERQISQIRVNGQTGRENSRSAGLNLASPVVLRKGENNSTFLISWQSREHVIHSLGWKSMAMVFGGGGLMLMGIYVLLLQAGML